MSVAPSIVDQVKPFKNAILFSGGGLRFGYYLGMYQALCDHGQPPDLILASCGGAFIAGLLEVTYGDSQQAFERLQSRDCYNMLCRITPNPPKHVSEHALCAFKRLISAQIWKVTQKTPVNFIKRSPMLSKTTLDKLTTQNIAYIKDESNNYPLWPWQSLQQDATINSIIIASRLLTHEHDYQWQVLLRCNHPALASELRYLNLTNTIAKYQPNTIHQDHWITSDMPLEVAVRASISDMYYLPPFAWQDHMLMGGVINLTPIELACQLANEVYAETKPNYDRLLAEPAIHSTFGFLANERLKHVRQYQQPDTQIHWIDTSDNARHIRPAMAKKLRLCQGYIDVSRPDFKSFQSIMFEQFRFGYQRTLDIVRR